MPIIKKAFSWYFKSYFLREILDFRILQKVLDPYGSGSGFGSGFTTLFGTVKSYAEYEKMTF
jgi:hypothetical protein